MNETEQLQTEFIQFQKELKSFVYRLVANEDDAEDLAQDAYLKAFKNIESFKGNSSFKTWVFAIAANLAKNFLKSKSRWHEDYQDNCRTATYASQEIQGAMVNIAMNSAHGKFVIREHIDYCFTCMSKTLLLEQQICLILKEMYEFKVAEIIEITELTEGKVKYHLKNGRDTLQEIFERKCSLVGKQGACHQCSELNGMFNPQQNTEEEFIKLKMVKEQKKANYSQLFNLRLQLVKSISPVESKGFDLHNYMLENLPSHSS